jgi:ribose transport system permease protein
MADPMAIQESNVAPGETDALAGSAAESDLGGRGPSLWQRLLQVPWIGVLVAIILISVYLTIEKGTIFLSTSNLSYVALDFSYIAIAALGSAIVLIGGGIDLSVAAVMGLTGLLVAQELNAGWPIALAILAGLGLGALVGMINSFMITTVRLLPFIVTLGMMSALRGFGTGWVSGQTLGTPDAFNVIGQGLWGQVPISVVLLLVLAVLCHLFINNTTWGRHIYAVGGHENAARLLGIKINRVKWMIYIIAGLLASTGGIVLTARLGSAAPDNALGYELICIASAVIGGASLTGGEGSIFGVVIGAALLALITNGINLMGWGNYWQEMVIGLTILLAVTVDQLRRRLRRA